MGLPVDFIPYITQLDKAEDAEFKTWVSQNKVPFDERPGADYDMRGYWKALKKGDPRASSEKKADGLHFPDTWKTPSHRTFSNESIYAGPDAPKWNGSKLISPNGKLVFDEDAQAASTSADGEEGTLREILLRAREAEDRARRAAAYSVSDRARDLDADRKQRTYGLKKDGSSSRLRKILAGAGDIFDGFSRGVNRQPSQYSELENQAEKNYQLENAAMGADATNSRSFAGTEARAYHDRNRLAQEKELAEAKNEAALKLGEMASGPKMMLGMAALKNADTKAKVAAVMSKYYEARTDLVEKQTDLFGLSKPMIDTSALYSMDPDKREQFQNLKYQNIGEEQTAKNLAGGGGKGGGDTRTTHSERVMPAGTDENGKAMFMRVPVTSVSIKGGGGGGSAANSPFIRQLPSSPTNVVPARFPGQQQELGTPPPEGQTFVPPTQKPQPAVPAKPNAQTFREVPPKPGPKEFANEPNARIVQNPLITMPGLTKENATALRESSKSAVEATNLMASLMGMAVTASPNRNQFEIDRYTGVGAGVKKYIDTFNKKIPLSLINTEQTLERLRNDYIRQQTGASRGMKEMEMLSKPFSNVGTFSIEGPIQTMQKTAILHFVSNAVNWKIQHSMTNPNVAGYVDFSPAIQARIQKISEAIPSFQAAVRNGTMSSAKAKTELSRLMNAQALIDEVTQKGLPEIELRRGK